MKLLVISDSHGRHEALRKILEKEKDCDMIVHLGDGARDMDAFLQYTIGKPLYIVRGNCDVDAVDIAPQHTLTAGDIRVLACHGHLFRVEYGLERLYLQGLKENVWLCLFGHTHIQTAQRSGDMLLVNPGAAKDRRYAVVEIDGEKVIPVLKTL